MERKYYFNFDVNMTQKCTLRCTYCIENFNKPKLENITEQMLDKIIEKFRYLLNSKEFNEKYSGIGIFFWGGEPTVNFKGMKKLIEEFKNDNNVCFFVYSNGFHYTDEFLEYIASFKDVYTSNNQHKINLQISYDGLASHDVSRLDIKGKGSALKVKENIFRVNEMNIPFTLHPTISFDNFDKISDNYFEFKRLSEVLKKNFIYSPTIDYLSDFDFSMEVLNDHINTIKNEFKKIKDQELEFYKKNKHFRFGWLNPSKKLCAAGKSINAIEMDGNSYACHGILNGSVKEESVENSVNLSNEEFLSNLLNNTKKYEESLKIIPPECRDCKTHYCLKCNAKKFEVSKKETFQERWSDYPNQPHLCVLYKFIGNVRLAFLKILGENSEIQNQITQCNTCAV
jgi:hypothetical phage protein (radical SAM family)|nr:MAG TPA: Fe-S oxidoreductase [Caudoviricetes sp.]